MENKENKNNSALQDYEIEISEKNSFISRFLNKLKPKKNLLLLGSGEEERKKSSDLLWRITGYKSNIFDKFDSLKRKGYIRNYIDKLIYEVIGNENIKNNIDLASKKIQKLIIPKNIGKKKNEDEE